MKNLHLKFIPSDSIKFVFIFIVFTAISCSIPEEKYEKMSADVKNCMVEKVKNEFKAIENTGNKNFNDVFTRNHMKKMRENCIQEICKNNSVNKKIFLKQYKESDDYNDIIKLNKKKDVKKPVHIIDEAIDVDDEDMIRVTRQQAEAEKKNDEVYTSVEIMPKFRNGDISEFIKYVNSQLKYPEIDRLNGISGRVIVQFVVNKTGKVTNAKIVRGINDALNSEALRVVNSSPQWEPGMHKGKTVNVQYLIPVNFVLK